MPRVCGCVSLWMTVNLWGRTFGSRGVTLDCGTMNVKNTFSEAQYMRCCAVPLCGSENGATCDLVCVAQRVVAGWDRWDNVRGCAPWEGGSSGC